MGTIEEPCIATEQHRHVRGKVGKMHQFACTHAACLCNASRRLIIRESAAEGVGEVGKVSAHEASTAAKTTVKQGKDVGEQLVEDVVDQWNTVEGRIVRETREKPGQCV